MPEPSRSIVSNTSPLFYLHTIGRLNLLEQLYGRVTVPVQVVSELAAGAMAGHSVPEVRHLGWCEIRDVTIPATLEMIPDLGVGEAAVIALALEAAERTTIILDDGLARRIAALHNLAVTGTAGVLLRAKERGLVTQIRPVLRDLIAAGFHLHPDHLEMVCQMAGE